MRMLRRFNQLKPADRFADVIVHSGGSTALTVALHRVGGHCNDVGLPVGSDMAANPAGTVEGQCFCITVEILPTVIQKRI